MNEQISNQPINLQGMAPLFQVFDMPISLHFYRDILGFKIVQSSGEGDDVDWVLLRLNGIEVMLNTAFEKDMRPASPDTDRLEAHKDTTLYFGCPDVEETYTILLNKGMNLNKPIKTGYGWKAIYVNDPDDYLLCFHWPFKEAADN
jgi:glyoxylase I family protein